MKRPILIAAVVLSAAISAQEVAPPAIHLVSPNHGPVAGGTIVNIYGERFDAKINCIVPCPTMVLFGDSEGELLFESDGLVAALSPPHEEGSVPLTIRRSDGVEVTSEFSYTSGSNPWEPILLPILIDPTRGAFGSLWQSTFWLHNASNEVIELAHLECEDVCPEVFPLTLNVEPGETVENPRLGFNPPGATPGTLIYVLRDKSEGAHFSLRIEDLSREALTRGTEIPVIRREELVSGVAELVDVPVGELFRSALRIYDLDARARLDFHVRIFPVDEGAGPGEPVVQMRLSTSTETPGPLGGKPGFVQVLDLAAAYPRLAPLRRVRVEIEPVTPGIRYWAFATATNVTTQQVTTITPQ